MGSHGVGLRGMNERMRQLGGTLKLSSTATGTKVIATAPISKDPLSPAPNPLDDAGDRHALEY